MASAVLCSHCQRNAADTFLSGSALCHYCAQVSFQHNTPCVVCSHKKASSVCTCEFPLVAVCEDCSNSHRLKASSTGHVLQPLNLLYVIQSSDDLYRFQSRLTRIELVKRNLRDLSLRKIEASRAEFNLYTQELAKTIESFAADVRGQLDRAYGQIEGVINALEKLKFDFYKAPENLFEDFAVNDEAGDLVKSSQESFRCIQFSISSQLFEETLRETVQFALTIPQVRKGQNQADSYYQEPTAVANSWASWENMSPPQVLAQDSDTHLLAVQARHQPSQYQPGPYIKQPMQLNPGNIDPSQFSPDAYQSVFQEQVKSQSIYDSGYLAKVPKTCFMCQHEIKSSTWTTNVPTDLEQFTHLFPDLCSVKCARVIEMMGTYGDIETLPCAGCRVSVKKQAVLDNRMVVLSCGHFLHDPGCLAKWLEQGGINFLCPMCKTPIDKRLIEGVLGTERCSSIEKYVRSRLCDYCLINAPVRSFGFCNHQVCKECGKTPILTSLFKGSSCPICN